MLRHRILAPLMMMMLAAAAVGCSSGDDSQPGGGSGPDTNDTGGPGGTGSNGTFGATCSPGSLGQIEAGYDINAALSTAGGFYADKDGLVFAAMPDARQAKNTTSMPTKYYAATLDGKITLLHSAENEILGSVFVDGKDAYVTHSKGLARVPRAGGSPVDVLTKPVKSVAFVGDALFALDGDRIVRVPKAGGEAVEVLPEPDKSSVSRSNLTADGEDLYWSERDGFDENGPDLVVQKLAKGETTPTRYTSIPRAIGLNQMQVRGGVLVFNSVSLSPIGVSLRVVSGPGAAPRVLEEKGGGAPMAVGKDAVYWNSAKGIMKASLSGGEPQRIANGVSYLGAMAVGDDALYYGEIRCLHKVAK